MKNQGKTYVTPAIETLDSAEIVELLGPVQGYGPGSGTGGAGSAQSMDAIGTMTGGIVKVSR